MRVLINPRLLFILFWDDLHWTHWFPSFSLLYLFLVQLSPLLTFPLVPFVLSPPTSFSSFEATTFSWVFVCLLRAFVSMPEWHSKNGQSRSQCKIPTFVMWYSGLRQLWKEWQCDILQWLVHNTWIPNNQRVQ